MAYEHKENSGSAFPNDRKENPSQPDYTGSINVEGKVFRVAMWNRQQGNGFNIKVSVPQRRGPGPQPNTQRGSQNPPF